MNLLHSNKHWIKNFKYDYKIQRVYFDEIAKKLDNKYIQLLI